MSKKCKVPAKVVLASAFDSLTDSFCVVASKRPTARRCCRSRLIRGCQPTLMICDPRSIQHQGEANTSDVVARIADSSPRTSLSIPTSWCCIRSGVADHKSWLAAPDPNGSTASLARWPYLRPRRKSLSMSQMRWLIRFGWYFTLLAHFSQSVRVPAVPLITHDPYSVSVDERQVNGCPTRTTGAPSTTGWSVDGQVFRWMGDHPDLSLNSPDWFGDHCHTYDVSL